MLTPDRLRLATRIHFALRRHHGLDIEVERLLDGGSEAREALWVCEASDDEELRLLAADMRRTERALAAARAARKAQAEAAARGPRAEATVPQDAAWSRNTSGFGLSAPLPLDGASAEGRARSWFKPGTWRRRHGDEPQS